MNDFLEKLKAVITKGDRVNHRDRRGHYASGIWTCLRDQFWSLKGEPETNPTDFKGAMKMKLGDAVEKIIVETVLTKMSFVGYHFRGTQVAVGQSNPDWNGYLDALMYHEADKVWTPFVLEIKTKSGFGADLFGRQPEPSLEYMTQLGLYLKNEHERGITNKGMFLYVLLSDKSFGDIITIDCEYDPTTNSIRATRWVHSDGTEGKLDYVVPLQQALDRLKKLNEYVEKNEVPPPDYKYKYPLTPETVKDIPDAKLKKIIEGSTVHGDWQPLYSRFKNKALAADGLSPSRTEEELKVAVVEYRKRHPRTKL